MLPQKIAFVDVETTGIRASYDKIIEIGIIRVEENKITKKFSTLINPQTYIPPEITKLTGITDSDIAKAPTFRSTADEILETIDNCVMVAHNARFDYSFLRSEFKREGRNFSTRHFCTVRLSQLVFPKFKHHNLDSIIKRFAINCQNRHRAMDDAFVLYEFYKKLQETISHKVLTKAVSKALKRPTVPINLKLKDLDMLPELPGVYTFYGKDGAVLYIGKSINIRDRVLSHFSGDLTSPLEMKISSQIKSIETVTTSGELGALLLESHLIKQNLPLYNRMLRKKQLLAGIFAQKSTDDYLELSTQTVEKISPAELFGHNKNDPEKGFIGFFKSKKQAKSYLATLAKKNNLCEKRLGLEKTPVACFGYRLDRCKGACIKKEKSLFFNLRLIQAISDMTVKPWPFKSAIVIKEVSPLTGISEYFLIYLWCFIGKVKEDEEDNLSLTGHEMEFDLDTYKILKRFILNPKNSRDIKVFSEKDTKYFI